MRHPALPGFEVYEARTQIEDDEVMARTLSTGIDVVLFEAGIALPQYPECQSGYQLPDEITVILKEGMRELAAEWYTRGAHDEHEGMIVFRPH